MLMKIKTIKHTIYYLYINVYCYLVLSLVSVNISLLICTLLFLSLHHRIPDFIIYPWDMLLLECGWISIAYSGWKNKIW
jgi:hypothetical protein